MTERRKAGTRRDLARAACRLFAERGADATTAEEIARQAGVGLRTFYRYFRTREDAVEPMLADGAHRWLALIPGGSEEGLPGPEALREVAVTAPTPEDADATEAMRLTGGLLRAADDDPALRTVWARINLDAEHRLVAVLAERAGPEADPLTVRMLAAGAAGAIRVAVEQWSARPDGPTTGPGSPSDLVARSMLRLTGAVAPESTSTG
ncbi:TetR family transcriptional regulator [Streptomyces nodosus]